MPKVRERSRIVQDFAVTPWQSRHVGVTEPAHLALYSVVEADLLAPRQTFTPRLPQESNGNNNKPFVQYHEPGDDNPGWFTKVPRRQDPGDDDSDRRRLEAAGSSASGPSAAFSRPDTEGSEDVGTGECVGIASGRALRPLALTGLCQLAITPTGYGMGHILVATNLAEAATKTSNLSARKPGFPSRSAARCYGLAVRPVLTEVPPDPCFEDDGTQLLHALLTNFINGATVELMVARTGGDMCCLGPPPDWLSRRVFGDSAGSDAESEDEEETEEASEGEEEADSTAEREDEEGEGWEEAGSENTERGGGPTSVCRGSRVGRSRRRRRPPGCELHFEAETLLSGAAAVPKLREFARPLLPKEHLEEVTEEGHRAVGGAGVDEDRGGRGVGGGGAEGWGKSEGQEAVEAVVCLGSATLRGLPAPFFEGDETTS